MKHPADKSASPPSHPLSSQDETPSELRNAEVTLKFLSDDESSNVFPYTKPTNSHLKGYKALIFTEICFARVLKTRSYFLLCFRNHFWF